MLYPLFKSAFMQESLNICFESIFTIAYVSWKPIRSHWFNGPKNTDFIYAYLQTIMIILSCYLPVLSIYIHSSDIIKSEFR